MPDAADLPAPVAPPVAPQRDAEELTTLVPSNPRRGYDMRKVLQAIVDEGSLFTWGERFGRSLITALARIEGQAVGVVASQPMQRAGVLDVPALTKELRFVELCDTFNLPLVFLQDVPGLMIGTEAERGGILACYEKLASMLAQTTVPKIAVIVRKAYGGGHIAMGGRPVNPDLLVAWPSAEMGFMAPDVGIRTVFRRRLEARRGRAGHRGAQRARGRARGRVGGRVPALGGGGQHHPRRRHRPARDAPGDRRGDRLRVGHPPARERPGEGLMATVDAHITGTVWTVDVAVGDVIEEGDVVAVLESMKMEMPVESEVDGTVAEVLCATGDAVTEGQALVRLV